MTGTHSCIRCGDAYAFTNVYKGNYCIECRGWWLHNQRPSHPHRRTVTRWSRTARTDPDEREEDDATDVARDG